MKGAEAISGKKVDDKNKQNLKDQINGASSKPLEKVVGQVKEVTNTVNDVVNSPVADIVRDMSPQDVKDGIKKTQEAVNTTNNVVNSVAPSFMNVDQK